LAFIVDGQRLTNFQDGFVWKFVFLNRGWVPMNTHFPMRPRRRIFPGTPLACSFGVSPDGTPDAAAETVALRKLYVKEQRADTLVHRARILAYIVIKT
jgi:hypothetical protein